MSGQCKFKSECAYKHSEAKDNEEQQILMEKVRRMETATQALTRKVLSLEEEVKRVKEKKKKV